MSYFGDQESQIVAPFWDPPNDVPPSPTSYHDPCSAPQMGNDNQGRPGSDDTIEDHHGPEVEQDSCISRVGETQFVGLEQDSCASRETQSVNLEPETQALDDLVSDSPTIDRLLYHADTSTSTEVRKNDTPLTFTRPKDIGQEDVHGGFRFSRAEKPKPGQFSRPVAKASDVHANSKPTEAFTSLPIPLPESTIQLDQLGSRPSLNVRQDRNSTEESEAELPRSTITSMGQNAAPVPPVKDLQVDAGRPERIIQQAAMTPVKFSSPRPAQRVVSSNKGCKRMFKKQPFPEVARTPSNQYSEDMVSLATRDFVDFVDVDTNSPNPNRVTKPPFQEALSSETPPHFNVVREPNQGSASCQPMSMAADLTPCQLPEPSMGNHHNYRGTTNYGAMDNQCQGQQSFKGLENVVDMSEANSDVIHDIEVYENFLTNVNLPQSVRRDDSSIRLQNIPEPQSDHRNYVSELCHRSLQPPYRPSSQPNSRPQSRRSNHGVSMARPIAADDLCAKGTSEYTILHASHQMKTKKSTGGKNHTNPAAKPHAVIDSQKRDNNGTLSDFQKFFRQAADIEEKLLDYGSKIELVESQKLQIEKLQGSNQECKAQLKALESEKDKLQKKIDKYAELSSKYKDHINQVAVSQKWLLNQARKMKDDKKAIMEASTTFAKSEAHFQNLEAMIKEAKGFRVPAIQLEKLSKENEQYKAALEAEKMKTQLLNSDLDKRVLELGRERHHSEQYQNQLNGQAAAHKEVVEQLTKYHTGIMDELTKEDGILARILSSESATQAKIEEISNLFKTATNHEAELPPALIKLVKDLCTMIETKLQVTDNNEAIWQESGTKLFEEFDERLNQIRVDSEAQNRLNDRIAELREANATLTAGMSSRELEVQTMTMQVDGLRLDLTDCRGQLTAKSDELAATFALPREDQQLRRKLQELESVNETLRSQVEAAKQETTLANEELRNLRDTALETQDQLEEIEGKLSVAQDSVKKLTEEKKKYMVTSKTEADNARQEVAKAASASKAEMMIRHDALVRSLEQRRAEVETQLRLVKEELQRSQNDRTAFSSNFDKLQTELNYYKEQFLLQETHINRLEEKNLDREETERRAISIQETHHETVELRNLHEQMRSEVAQRTDAALRAHKEVEDKLRKVDDLKKENELLELQKMDLQLKLDSLTPSVNHPNTKSRVIEGHPSHQFEPISSRESQAIASHECQTRPSNISPSQFTYNADDILRSGHRTTPMKPLRNTSNQRHLASGAIVSLPGRHSPLRFVDAGIMGPPPQVTRSPFQKASLLTTSDSPLELQMISPQQSMSDLRPLRPARRKSSNTAQPQQLQTREQVLSRTETTKYSFQKSTMCKDEQAPHLVNEKSANRQSPAEIQPFSAMTLIGAASSSPLPNIVSIIEHLECPSNQVDHLGAYKKNLMNHDPGPGELPSDSRPNATRRGERPARFAKNTTAAHLTRNGTPLSYQFSDFDEFPAATINVHKTGPSAAEESSRRRELQPLKGVLKKPGAVPKTINNRVNSGKRPSATFEPSDTAPLQDRTSARVVNRNQSRTQAKNTGGGSSYNRVASGKSTKSNAMDVASDHFSHTPHQTPIGQQGNNTEKSPPMTAPRRNSLKRAASSVLLAEKPAKAPRLSLERRYSGRVIPNSQEAEYC